MPAPSQPPKRKLRWYQFSLWTLLIVVTLFACACSWFAVKMGQARRQQLAVEEVTTRGGRVYYNCSERRRDDGDSARVPLWLRMRLGDDFFYDVVSADANSLETLDAVRDLPRCTDLQLDALEVNDSLGDRLDKFPQLKTIAIYDPRYDYAAIDRLRKRLPRCEIATIIRSYRHITKSL
jgi:hypothetical protein